MKTRSIVFKLNEKKMAVILKFLQPSLISVSTTPDGRDRHWQGAAGSPQDRAALFSPTQRGQPSSACREGLSWPSAHSPLPLPPPGLRA